MNYRPSAWSFSVAEVWARRGVAVVGALASFGGCYWGLVAAYPAMDIGVAVGWSALPLTVVLGVLLGWAERPKPEGAGQRAPAVSVGGSLDGPAQVHGGVTNTISGGTQHGPVLQGRYCRAGTSPDWPSACPRAHRRPRAHPAPTSAPWKERKP